MIKETNKGMAAALARMLDTLEKKVNPVHTALIVVDMQNDFCATEGMLGREGAELSMLQSMAPKLASFINKAREAGVAIIFIQNIESMDNDWYISDVLLEHFRRTAKSRYGEYPVCQRGSWGAGFYEEIKPLPGDIIVNKHRYSAFIGTDLDLILKSRGIRTLIMSGATTNVCVESTARDAFMLDYYTIFLKDGTATYSEEVHNNTLKNIAQFFGEVVETNGVLKCWSLV
jgi:ureidoacrylate peracid hydrolase